MCLDRLRISVVVTRSPSMIESRQKHLNKLLRGIFQIINFCSIKIYSSEARDRDELIKQTTKDPVANTR